MAERPPEGSLLSNFLSGGSVGRPNFGSPKKKKSDYVPPYRLPPDQAALLGQGIAENAFRYSEDVFEGFKSELVGRGVLKRFGKEEKIYQMDHDYLTKSLTDLGDSQTAKDLQIENLTDYVKSYKPWREAEQAKENAARIKRGDSPIEGVGIYGVKTYNANLFNPRKTFSSLRKTALASSAGEILKQANIGDHPEIPFFTKREEAGYLEHFLNYQTRQAYAQAKTDLKNPALSPSARLEIQAKKDRLGKLLIDKFKERHLDPDKRTNHFDRLTATVSRNLVSRNLLIRAGGVISGGYGIFKQIDQDPLGFVIGLPFRLAGKLIWGRSKFFGRNIGFNLGGKFNKWLFKQGFAGKAVHFATSKIGLGLQKGVGSLTKVGFKFAGKLTVVAARFASRMLASAFMAIVAPVLGSTIGLVIIGVILVMIVFIPIFQGLGSQAAGATIPPGLFNIKSQKLVGFFNDAASKNCVPPAMLLAIAEREASGTFSYTDDQVTKFSTPGWWNGASQTELGPAPTGGYCYNTCTQIHCDDPNADVRGAMQFEAGTFAGYVDQLRAQLGHEPDRCNVQDAIYAAALKIKANSGTGSSECAAWSEGTVRQVARKYCGSCDSASCGGDYCDQVLRFYRTYASLGLPGNSAIVAAIAKVDKTNQSYSGWCGLYVDSVLAAAQYPTIGSSQAVDFYRDAPRKGYTVFPGYSVEPKPGDVVVFRDPDSPDGGPGHVDIVVLTSATSVFLTGSDYDTRSYARNGNVFDAPFSPSGTKLQQVGIIRAPSK